MGSHGGDDEGAGPAPLDGVHHGPGDDVDVADAGGDGDAHAGLDLLGELRLRDLRLHDARDLLGGDALARERLARVEHLGNLHACEQLGYGTALGDLHGGLLVVWVAIAK